MTTETSIYEYAKQGLALSADKPAIWFYGKSISYCELFEKIDNLADHLYELGVRVGSVVTIHLPNCPQAVIAIYAVAKLGGICNMIHPQVPRAALKKILNLTNSNLLLTFQSDCVSLAEHNFFVDPSAFGSEETTVDSFAELTKEMDAKADYPQQKSLADKCAVYFHSSGTTGQPKSVMHNHKSLNRQADKIRKFYHVEDLSEKLPVILGIFPLFHGAGFGSDLHETLSGGSELIMMSKWEPEFAASIIDSKSVAFMSGVPTVFESLLNCEGFTGKSLQLCAVAGEGVSNNLKRKFKERTGATLVEGYGMTENVAACCSEDRFEESGKGMLPYPGCQIALLSNSGFLSTGEGELIVSSDTLMLGYLNEESSTGGSFITADNQRWFRTGDQGKITESGRIFFLRRIKNIIIHKGYNIYPDEIDGITLECVAVDAACTVGHTAKDGDTESIVTFVVLKSDVDKSTVTERIRELWAAKLPRYAIPERIVFLESLPLNPVGKIDRNILESTPWEEIRSH